MTAIFYPDVSHYDRDRGVTIEPNTVAVVAKATHGTAFVDSAFSSFQQQAASRGSIFAGYHWLNHGGVQAQAAYYYAATGKTPCMIDAEDTDKNTGYNGPLTLDDIVGFAMALRGLGGICNLAYLPRWYWDSHMGGPSLQPLQDAGLHLVSSDYTTYSDAGPGWNVYVRDNGAVEPSGMRPVAWQYTDALPYGGGTSDFNAFRGTVDEFRALLTGGSMTDQLLNGWPQPINADGTPDSRGVGVYAADFQHFAWRGVGAYDEGQNDPAGPPSDIIYLDKLLKLIRDTAQKAADQAASAAKAAGQAVATPTQDQVNTAVLAAMLDARVQKGIGDAIATHLKVS